MHILLVEDNDETAEFIERGLVEAGDTVTREASGNAGLVAAAAAQFDAIIFDRLLPGMDGLDAVRVLRESSVATPILMLTALSGIEDRVAGLEAGADDYLLKPYSEERLDACLRKIRDAYQENNAFRKQRQLDQLLFRKTGKSLDAFVSTLEQSRQANLDDLQQHISVKSGTEWLRIKLDSILWIEAAGDYMCVHTLDTTHIVRKTLRQFEEELDVQRFPRINRSTIVNLTKVARLSPNSNGEYLAHLSSGQTVKVSRKYKLKLEELQRKSHVNPSGQSQPE